MNAPSEIRVEEWLPNGSPSNGSAADAREAASLDADIDILAEVLHAVVHAGAGVSFYTPFSVDEARAFWVERVLPQMRAGTRRVLVARLDQANAMGPGGKGKGEDDRIVGTVQLELEMPPNQKHRAAVAKLLVHPTARRRGIAKALMSSLEEIAISEGRSLLTLDTVSGSNAELLYRSLGYITVGIIPRFARGALTPELEGTTIMYKELTPAEG